MSYLEYVENYKLDILYYLLNLIYKKFKKLMKIIKFILKNYYKTLSIEFALIIVENKGHYHIDTD